MKQVKLGMIAIAALVASGAFTAAQAQFGGGPTDPPAQFQAMLIDHEGTTLGPAGLWQTPGGVAVTLRVEFVPAGTYAVKVNATGKCDGPDFGTTGAAAATPGNITINGNGYGFADFTVAGATLDSWMDADGASITLESADGKVACGVFKKPVFLKPRSAARG